MTEHSMPTMAIGPSSKGSRRCSNWHRRAKAVRHCVSTQYGKIRWITDNLWFLGRRHAYRALWEIGMRRHSESILPLWTQLRVLIMPWLWGKALKAVVLPNTVPVLHRAEFTDSTSDDTLEGKGVCNIVQQQECNHLNIRRLKKETQLTHILTINIRIFISMAIVTPIYHWFIYLIMALLDAMWGNLHVAFILFPQLP